MKLNKNSCVLIIFSLSLIYLYYYVFGLSYNKENQLEVTKNFVNKIDQVYDDEEKLNLTESSFKVIYLKSDCECKVDQLIEIHKYHAHFEVKLVNVIENVDRNLFTMTYDEFLETNITCNLFSQFKRGKSQKVIGYSLYGQNRFYYEKLKNLTSQLKKLYPDWSMKIYHDDSINKSIICEIECAKDEQNKLIDNADFCHVQNDVRLKPIFLETIGDTILDLSFIHAMKWRWLPIGDSFVSVFSSRDSDSFILQREVDSVNVWLESNKIGHIMRDHPQHGTSILGGMWGFYNSRNRDLANKIFDLIKNPNISKAYSPLKNKNRKGADQQFLTKYVFPLIKNNSTIHDSFLCSQFGGEPFPTRRLGNCFIGSPYDCNITGVFHRDCPEKCRPSSHKDWKQC